MRVVSQKYSKDAPFDEVSEWMMRLRSLCTYEEYMRVTVMPAASYTCARTVSVVCSRSSYTCDDKPKCVIEGVDKGGGGAAGVAANIWRSRETPK